MTSNEMKAETRGAYDEICPSCGKRYNGGKPHYCQPRPRPSEPKAEPPKTATGYRLTVAAPFNCPRTCRTCETVDVCRFNLLLASLGIRRLVNSETVQVDVNFEDETALRSALARIGAEVLGFGTFKLWVESATGFAFKMPYATYPVVIADGAAKFDNMFANFGDEQAEKLRLEYSLAAADQAAARLGWLAQRIENPNGASLRVFHPTGGYLDIGAGSVEAFQFSGGGCHNAAAELAAAMGEVQAVQPKAEFYNQTINQQLQGE